MAAESKNKELRPWVPDIINHFWYCSKTANGSKDVLLVSLYLFPKGSLHNYKPELKQVLRSNLRLKVKVTFEINKKHHVKVITF